MTQSAISGRIPPVETTVSPGPRARRLWLTAAGIGLAVTWLLFDAAVGINWPITVALVSAGLYASAPARAAHVRNRPAQLPVALALLLAGGGAVTTNGALHFWMFLGIVTLLGAATLLLAGRPPSWFRPFRLATASLRALPPVVQQSTRRLGEEARLLLRDDSHFRAVRGAALALPVVIVFFLLLATADPTFEAWRDQIELALRDQTLLPRAVFFVLLTGALLGFYGLSLREQTPTDGHRFWIPPGLSLSGPERVIVLGSVAALFALFLVLQAGYLFGDPGARVGSGITYAEAVRRGFGELIIVVTLSAWLVLGCDRWALRDAHEARVRWLHFVLVFECLLLLASAAHRLAAYQAAYGYTSARLYVAIYIAAAVLALAALAWEIGRGIDLARLTRHVAVVAVLALCTPAYWNLAAWVVEKNLERYEATGELDADYLAIQVSDDGLSAVAASLPRLTESDRACVVRLLQRRERSARESRGNSRSWYEWNPREMRAREVWEAPPLN